MLIAEIDNNNRFWTFPQKPLEKVVSAPFALPVSGKEGNPPTGRENRRKKGIILRVGDLRKGNRRRADSGRKPPVELERRRAGRDHRQSFRNPGDYDIVVVAVKKETIGEPRFRPGEEVILEPRIAPPPGSPENHLKQFQTPGKTAKGSKESPEQKNPDFVIHISGSRPL